MTIDLALEMVRKARSGGLRVPVLLMGYYNPLLIYGEERIIEEARKAGVNGFIVVDLPPEEAVRFRNFCARGGYVFLAFLFLGRPALTSRMKAVICSSDRTCHVRDTSEAAMQDCRFLHLRCLPNGSDGSNGDFEYRIT